MCIIAIKGKGIKLPKSENLLECASRNKDGMGIAYLKDGTQEVVIKKDFVDNEAFMNWIYANIKEEDICIIHYRYATHGITDEGNRHPFPITNNKELLRRTNLVCRVAVAHNGIIRAYGAHKKYSDTQKFVYDILAEDLVKNNFNNPTVHKLVNNFLGGDRLAVLQANGEIFTWGEWEEFEGIWYSNSGYEVRKYNTGFSHSTQQTFEGACDYCSKVSILHFTDDSDYIMLCKKCMKAYRKGRIKISLTKLQDIEDNEGNTTLSKLEQLSLTDDQCENCQEWVDKTDISNYYGHSICSKCRVDLEGYENMRPEKSKDLVERN